MLQSPIPDGIECHLWQSKSRQHKGELLLFIAAELIDFADLSVGVALPIDEVEKIDEAEDPGGSEICSDVVLILEAYALPVGDSLLVHNLILALKNCVDSH